MNEEINKKLKHYRLNLSEYDLINRLLSRPPEGVEWALFSALWSEHCSYKSSKIHLKKFYSKHPRVLQSFGENAGVIDLGMGERVAFKMESHNHPSFIEPFQGAATGVGGILRDIFTMGARPIALANYLCFGDPASARMSFLVDGVVRGISSYGNCVGVPNITGQTDFNKKYDGNILVNALALGLFEPGEKVFTSQASGIGNLVVYVGAKTGKDGVHGASMASESFDENSESKRPNIQVGDPFYEKLLIESCIEVMNENLVVAIQDMGAAGLTSSSFEMASKGGVGLNLDLSKVPLRDSSMNPEEILLSESQERMLLICEPQKLEKLKIIFQKWDLEAEVIGEITEGKNVNLYWRGELLTSVNPDLLVENAPRYERAYSAWVPKKINLESVKKISEVKNVNEKLIEILNNPMACSRSWIYEQYDQRVGGKTVNDCSDPFGIVYLPKSKRTLGLVLGCRPYLMNWDALEGAKDAIYYPAIELSSKGFEPLAVTDCLNFGNPEKPEIMSEFVATVEGMSKACETLQAPIISGNVSFYNETLGENIISTPSTGMVGLRNDVNNIPSSHFKSAGSHIFLLRSEHVVIDGLSFIEANKVSGFGSINHVSMGNFCELLRNLANLKGVESSRVSGKFGLAYTLLRMCRNNLGFKVNNGMFLETEGEGELNKGWFFETLYDVIFVVDKNHSADFAKSWSQFRIKNKVDNEDKLWRIGEVIENSIQFEGQATMSVQEILEKYELGWRKNFENLA